MSDLMTDARAIEILLKAVEYAEFLEGDFTSSDYRDAHAHIAARLAPPPSDAQESALNEPSGIAGQLPAQEAESVPVAETINRDSWLAALVLPDGYGLDESMPGIWEYEYLRDDGESMVSGTSWNHPALAAIGAWRAALASPPEQKEGADIAAIAAELARIDGYDPEDLSGGLYAVQWSGGSSPEPIGDAWNMDYLPKAERIAIAIASPGAQGGEA